MSRAQLENTFRRRLLTEYSAKQRGQIREVESDDFKPWLEPLRAVWVA